MKRYFLLLGLAIITLSSCLKDDPQKPPVVVDPVVQAATDDAAIKTYLAAHTDITATKGTSGIYYQIVTQGTGANPTPGSTITVDYTGKLLNDIPFTAQTSITSKLANSFPGWIIGLPWLKAGGRIILIMPSRYGYGNQDYGQISANSVLFFTIDLKSVQ
jgi:FKBP-type peptidyl-prolyl cis-trans isomerase FkpA